MGLIGFYGVYMHIHAGPFLIVEAVFCTIDPHNPDPRSLKYPEGLGFRAV